MRRVKVGKYGMLSVRRQSSIFLETSAFTGTMPSGGTSLSNKNLLRNSTGTLLASSQTTVLKIDKIF